MHKNMIKTFTNICKLSQFQLKVVLRSYLKNKYDEVIFEDGFIFAKGDVPILLVAHMDTVHKSIPTEFEIDNGKLSSPQGIGGDDRCGVYMIREIIKKHKCSVLFTEDEEVGAIGASKFLKHDFVKELDFNYIIELDRKGSNEAVFYDCDNPEFEDFITKDGDWETKIGSFTDISVIAPELGCAAVNLSCGYYNAHTLSEYVVLDEMEKNIKNVCKLIERTTEKDKFEYIEAKYNRYGYGYGYGYDEGSYYLITYYDENRKESYEDYQAFSNYEALGMFMVDHPTLSYDNIIDIEDYGEGFYTSRGGGWLNEL